MFNTDFLEPSDIKKIYSYADEKYKIVEYLKDISLSPSEALPAYYMEKMNVHKRQAVIDLAGDGVILQAGAMQWLVGDIQIKSDIKGAGDFAKKIISSKVTKESAVKPLYEGDGLLVLEPTYKHLIVIDNDEEWNGGVVLEDGLFLACDSTMNMKVVSRKNLSSGVLGGEGSFLLESPVPREEIVEIILKDDMIKIDGSYAIAWSPSLKFTVEASTKSLIGSAASGEGLVNVYRGTGKIWMTPVR